MHAQLDGLLIMQKRHPGARSMELAAAARGAKCPAQSVRWEDRGGHGGRRL